MNVLKPENEEATGIARYQDVKISNCYVKDVSRAGIVVGYTYQHDKFGGAALADETVKNTGIPIWFWKEIMFRMREMMPSLPCMLTVR